MLLSRTSTAALAIRRIESTNFFSLFYPGLLTFSNIILFLLAVNKKCHRKQYKKKKHKSWTTYLERLINRRCPSVKPHRSWCNPSFYKVLYRDLYNDGSLPNGEQCQCGSPPRIIKHTKFFSLSVSNPNSRATACVCGHRAIAVRSPQPPLSQSGELKALIFFLCFIRDY